MTFAAYSSLITGHRLSKFTAKVENVFVLKARCECGVLVCSPVMELTLLLEEKKGVLVS